MPPPPLPPWQPLQAVAQVDLATGLDDRRVCRRCMDSSVVPWASLRTRSAGASWALAGRPAVRAAGGSGGCVLGSSALSTGTARQHQAAKEQATLARPTSYGRLMPAVRRPRMRRGSARRRGRLPGAASSPPDDPSPRAIDSAVLNRSSLRASRFAPAWTSSATSSGPGRRPPAIMSAVMPPLGCAHSRPPRALRSTWAAVLLECWTAARHERRVAGPAPTGRLTSAPALDQGHRGCILAALQRNAQRREVTGRPAAFRVGVLLRQQGDNRSVVDPGRPSSAGVQPFAVGYRRACTARKQVGGPAVPISGGMGGLQARSRPCRSWASIGACFLFEAGSRCAPCRRRSTALC